MSAAVCENMIYNKKLVRICKDDCHVWLLLLMILGPDTNVTLKRKNPIDGVWLLVVV
jgi:hypothetical protein